MTPREAARLKGQLADRLGLDDDQVTLVQGMGGSATLLDLPVQPEPVEAEEVPGQRRLGLFGRDPSELIDRKPTINLGGLFPPTSKGN